jgi:hypothetical protein
MAKFVQIGSTTYQVPEAGENPGWGEGLSDYLVAIADALADTVGPNDKLITSVSLANNQSSPANISGLVFNTGEVQGVEVDYFITRIYDAGSSTLVERGKILGTFDGSVFTIGAQSVGDSETFISVTNAGQFQYTTSNLTNHVSSLIRYRAKTIDTP